MKPKEAEKLLLGIQLDEFRISLERIQREHGLRIQLGWKGKHAYLQVVPIDGNIDRAGTVLKVTKGARMRWAFSDEEHVPFVGERVECGECGALLPEVRRG